MVKVLTSIKQIPANVQNILDERETARRAGDFVKSDQLRDELKQLGYAVNDSDEGVEVFLTTDSHQKPADTYLVLFGSGEIAPSSVAIYRDLFLSLHKRDLTLSLLTTPAGFQPNAFSVYSEIKDYLLTSLPDFNLHIHIIPAHTKDDVNNQDLLKDLDTSDLIMLGPGSPTYATKTLMGSLALKKIQNRVGQGSSLILASASAVAFSRHCLPVYEIYKVGSPLYWEEGLNFFCDYYQPCTIIPHFNNREGGKKLDTSYCYMGKARGEKLLALLPKDEEVWGIDEHTAVIINRAGELTIRGKRQLHILRTSDLPSTK